MGLSRSADGHVTAATLDVLYGVSGWQVWSQQAAEARKIHACSLDRGHAGRLVADK